MLLRAACVRQRFELAAQGHTDMPSRAVSWFEPVWMQNYDAVEHLIANHSPFMSIAFPVEVFCELGMRFDETLSTTEDWAFTTRLAMICGVASTPEITSVYRWWTNGVSSQFTHDPKEWEDNYQRIISDLDSKPILLPGGSVSRIKTIMDQNQRLGEELSELQVRWTEAQGRIAAGEARSNALVAASEQSLQAIQASSIWRATRPLRFIARRFPLLAVGLRRSAKVAWWTISLQLPRRYRSWRKNR